MYRTPHAFGDSTSGHPNSSGRSLLLVLSLHLFIHSCIYSYIYSYRQTDRQTDIETYRHTDIQTHTHIYMILYTELDELGFNVLISTLFYTKVICQRHTFTENGDVRTPVSSSAVAPPRCVAPWSASAPSSARRSSRRAPRSGRRRSDVAT